MRNLILLALCAMVFTFQGEVFAAPITAHSQLLIQTESPVDGATLQAVFNNIAGQTAYTMEELWSGYGQGTIEVEQINLTQYSVSITDLSEGIIDIVISDNL